MATGSRESYVVKVTSKGQITLPATIRKKYHIQADQKLCIVEKNGVISLHPFPSIEHLRGIIPVKGKQDFKKIRESTLHERAQEKIDSVR